MDTYREFQILNNLWESGQGASLGGVLNDIQGMVGFSLTW